MLTTLATAAHRHAAASYHAYNFRMFRARAKRQLRSIMTIFAMVVVTVATLAPALSNALGHSRVANWVELCSAQGSKRIAVNAAGEPISPAEQAMQHSEHCPFCHIEHSPAMLPQAPLSLVPQTEAQSSMPALFYAAPSASYAWAPALSRGPPAVS